MAEEEINLSGAFGGLSLGEKREGREVTATHFDILGLKYKYYGVTKCEEGVATYPLTKAGITTYPLTKAGKKVKEIVTFEYAGGRKDSVVDLDKFPFCCLWREETSDHLTQVFFLCKDIKGAEKVTEVLLNGGNTADVFPKIQNNYDNRAPAHNSEAHKFNNIALCGDWTKGEAGWSVDRVMHLEVPKKVDSKDDTPGKGWVYHVTNELAADPLPWTEISALSRKKYLCHYHGTLPASLPVCFVSSTLYQDKLPTFSMYPEKDGDDKRFYHRIKIPVSEVAQKLPSMFFWCSAPSPEGVGQMYFICGDKAKHGKIIKGVLNKCISVDTTKKSFDMSVFNDYENSTPKKTYNIIAVPQ